MSANAQQAFLDLDAINAHIRRINVPPIKQTLREISDSRTINASLSNNGLKAILVERLLAHFAALKAKGAVEEYRESKRIFEKCAGPVIPMRQNFSYIAPQAQASTSNLTAQQQYYGQIARSGALMNNQHHAYAAASVASSAPSSSNLIFQPARRPTFKPTPFMIVREWVGPAVTCPENPSTGQRSISLFKLQLNQANLEMLRRQTAVHQLRLFCTTKAAYEAAYNPNHPASVEFPIACEVKVNQVALSVNLKGKKVAAKVLAPEINKDKALYFGGQDNRIELWYQNTAQKYILSVAICEVYKAETLARRVRKENYKSRADVLKAMKRAAMDDDIEMGDVSIGLKCPLSYMRLNAPVRSTVCVHMSCFDAHSFFSVNEQTPSWQCPICFKSINPDTLFLDGYVQDILNKVPEEEETVLVDSDGRWHTPNNKFTSEDYIGVVPTANSSSALNDSSSFDSNQPSTKPIDSAGGSLKREASTPGLVAGPPQQTSRGKQVEVFEIDDDDNLVADSSSIIGGSENQHFSTDSEPVFQSLPSTSAMPSNGNSNGAMNPIPHPPSLASRLSHGPSSAQQPNYSSNSSRQSPATPARPAAQPSSTCEVIDLTLSDSEDERSSRVAAPSRPHAFSGFTRPPFSSTISHDMHGYPSVTNGVQNGSNGIRPGSSNVPLEGRLAPLPSINGHQILNDQLKVSAPLLTPPLSVSRRSSSSNDPQASNNGNREDADRYGESEDEEGGPLVRHRTKKKPRLDPQATIDDETSPARPSLRRKSASENSDVFQEDERAGLALR